MEHKKSRRRKKKPEDMLSNQLAELQQLIDQYKTSHPQEAESDELKSIEEILESSLYALYALSGMLNVPITIEGIAGRSSEKTQSTKLTFSQIARTLSKDYFSIYYVDLMNDHYVEYNSKDEYRELDIEKWGTDFFRELREKMFDTVYEMDQERMLNAFTKELVIEELERGHPFTISYRVILNQVPVYVSMKADYLDEKKRHILVGISSIDAQMKRELEYAKALKHTRELVDKDPLTGVKSKHAFKNIEEKLNRRIVAQIPIAFAIVICDVNNLKYVNDTFGHKAGDRYIREACHVICSVFRHSSVFRIGGDEFAVILQGQDYKNRHELLAEIREISLKNRDDGNVVIATGLSHFDIQYDTVMEDVFQRADEQMYHNKMELKKFQEEQR